jgi:hypothetical protein
LSRLPYGCESARLRLHEIPETVSALEMDHDQSDRDQATRKKHGVNQLIVIGLIAHTLSQKS